MNSQPNGRARALAAPLASQIHVELSLSLSARMLPALGPQDRPGPRRGREELTVEMDPQEFRATTAEAHRLERLPAK